MTFCRRDVAAHPLPMFLGLVFTTALTAACGGSTGVDGTSGGTGGMIGAGVTITLVSPARIQAQVAETLSLPDTQITARASGDLQALDGKVIYVQVEDTAGLFQPTASLSASSTDTYTLTLKGRPIAAAAHLTGTMKIHVSLDAAGLQPLGGSPLQIPYDVTVAPGIVVESDTITVEASFGTPTVVRDIQATTLDGALLRAKLEQGGDANWAPVVTVPGASTIRLTFPAAPPGTYNYTVDATASFPTFDYVTRRIAVTYVVTPSATPDYVFSPAEVAMTMPRGMPSGYLKYPVLLTNVGVTETSAAPAMEYLTHPPEADGNPFAQGWLTLLGQSPGTFDAYSWWKIGLEFHASSYLYTLPAGTYTARVGFTLQSAGVDQVVYLPITLVITP